MLVNDDLFSLARVASLVLLNYDGSLSHQFSDGADDRAKHRPDSYFKKSLDQN
jgi:hypothetical protein